MGTFYCKDCGYGVDSSQVDFYEDGWDFVCPRCGADNQWEDDGKGVQVTNPNRIPNNIDEIGYWNERNRRFVMK